MVDFQILEECGTTKNRLRELFTVVMPGGLATGPAITNTTTGGDTDQDKDCRLRAQIEAQIANRINEGVNDSLRFAHLYQASDLAWDSSTISKLSIPLVMYAQGRIKVDACVNELDKLGCKDQYVTKDPAGVETINMPKFVDTAINLVRSILTRRTAAQSARFSNLYPFFKYESRSTSEAARLRADVMSQRADIMADQFGYRKLQVESIRNMLMYGHCVAFPRCAWERDIEWSRIDISEEFKPAEGAKIPKRARVSREGVGWTLPHASRVCFDKAYPLASLNTDTGCEFVFFWDVQRYGDILDNPDYFNRDAISYNAGHISTFQNYSSYFSQYYTTITPPAPIQNDLASGNDRLNNVQQYNSAMRDSAVFVTHYYWKIRPNQYRMGDYPHPVWMHLVVANGRTVIFAEVMPSCPAAVFSYNESEQRLANLSMAHELMSYQDQLTNLFTTLLETIKQDLFKVAMLNVDIFPDSDSGREAKELFERAMRAENIQSQTVMLEMSFTKLAELLGPGALSADNIFKIVRTTPNTQIQTLMNAISQTIALAERMMSLSAQEQAQLSPRETSATEVQIIATTTENVYSFISDAIDEGRAAMKRYIYDATISLGSNEINTPVVGRYKLATIKAAGFDAEQASDDEVAVDPQGNDVPRNYTIIGSKQRLIGEYIFSSRDGAERSSNIQAAQALTQLLQVIMQPVVLGKITNDQFTGLLDTIFRLSGAGVDVSFESQPGQGGMPVLPPQPAGPPAMAAQPQMPQVPQVLPRS